MSCIISPKWAYVERPANGRRLAIGDIHGTNKSFEAMLNTFALTKDDQLFLLGDLISRGPSPDKVLDIVIDLKENGYNVFTLAGNHEEMLVEEHFVSSDDLINIALTYSNLSLLNEKNLIKEKYLNFILEQLFYYYETEDYYIVHAGFDTRTINPLLEYKTMLWDRTLYKYNTLVNGKRVIVGHTPVQMSIIRKRIENKEPVVILDNGVSKVLNGEIYGMGDLIGYNLDTFELYCQKNIDRIRV